MYVNLFYFISFNDVDYKSCCVRPKTIYSYFKPSIIVSVHYKLNENGETCPSQD